MRKKEKWMVKGAPILAIGIRGIITQIQENSINGVSYVYDIYVKLEQCNYDAPYHPADISELKLTTP